VYDGTVVVAIVFFFPRTFYVHAHLLTARSSVLELLLLRVGFGDICPGDDMTATGKIFLVLYSLSCVGAFCGPVMDLAASWKDEVSATGGGIAALIAWVIGVGVLLFTSLEGLSETDAVYASVITGQ